MHTYHYSIVFVYHSNVIILKAHWLIVNDTQKGKSNSIANMFYLSLILPSKMGAIKKK